MRIVIQPSGMCCLNVGDQAMLETAYGRLRAMWPQSEVRVFTWAPDEIRRTLPGAIPVSPRGRSECFYPKMFGRLSSSGYPLSKLFGSLEASLFRHAPAAQALAARLKMYARGHREAAAILSALQSTDLFVFSGAGIVTDAFASEAIECLETLALAKQLGARTAILGHMFGPVEHQGLRSACRRILPQVDFISVRERLTSLPFLAECGVRTGNVRVTGDEVLEFVGQSPSESRPRNALGVNLRAGYYSGYSGVNDGTTPLLSTAIKRLSTQLGARLEPLAVAHHKEDDDAATLGTLAAELGNGAHEREGARAFRQRIAGCRLVLTGSYHAAVFALGQGIPALGLVFSPYYEAKFKGLQDLFGPGCRYVDGRQRGWDQELQMLAADLWSNTRYWEEELVRSARRQSALSKAAYQELRTMVDGKGSSALPAAEPAPARVASEGA
jgi:polysaccharide pyruvyl transferase WcaK-like protein